MSDARIHPAARSFGRAAREYERGRPDYPAAAVDWIAVELGFRPGRTVLDLAAGTGKLTRALVATGVRVVAVEPSAEMRAVLQTSLPQVEALDGTAESIPLADESVDAIAVAQAFHWFRFPDAVRELGRVLRPGGGLAVIWNMRDESDPLQRWIGEELEPLRAGAPQRDESDPLTVLPASGLFGPVEHQSFDHRQELDEDAFVERFTSVSFVAALPPRGRREFETKLRKRVADEPRPIVLPYATEVFVARKL